MPAPDHYDVTPLGEDPYPRGRFLNGHFYGERLVECADTAIEALLEWFDASPNDVWPYDFGGWSLTALCQEAKVIPKPGGKVTSNSKPYIDFDRAWIHLKYSTEGMFRVGNYYLWEELRPGLHPMRFARAGLRWQSGNQEDLRPGEVGHTVFGTSGEYIITHFKLLAAPSAISTVWGKTNSTAYTTASLGYIFGVDTMLCTGAQVMRGSPGALTSSWKQARYVFNINLAGWNKLYRPETNNYEYAILPNGNVYYPQTPTAFTYVGLRT